MAKSGQKKADMRRAARVKCRQIAAPMANQPATTSMPPPETPLKKEKHRQKKATAGGFSILP
eukprot:CAMPEP_0117668560 /NCGR_PEP_ID=MMETSP0804-20121206/11619_1 /TAXON_ID=1074897 /ORGANISM="Tetraselmis astigmatica, Strain CCMP880" /LENGTH=61 /DNA_ID=CAMNT_0005476469 /DNA_START=527 /DNA_END=712 /DNA_ORIENTATION=-